MPIKIDARSVIQTATGGFAQKVNSQARRTPRLDQAGWPRPTKWCEASFMERTGRSIKFNKKVCFGICGG